jgi:hypothetical protein
VSIARIQRRLLGGSNRILWNGNDLDRIAKHYGYTGSLSDLLIRRDAQPICSVRRSRQHKPKARYGLHLVDQHGDVDHMFDRIFVDGWDLKVYAANPLVQYAHNASMLPIGRGLWTGVSGGRLKSKMVFSSDGFAKRVRAQVNETNLRAASVGFKPGEWRFSDDKSRPGGIDFIRGHQLLEWSICNVPANGRCLLERIEDVKSIADVALPAPTPRLDVMRAAATIARNRERMRRTDAELAKLRALPPHNSALEDARAFLAKLRAERI